MTITANPSRDSLLYREAGQRGEGFHCSASLEELSWCGGWGDERRREQVPKMI